MCKEDIREGRRKRTSVTTVTAPLGNPVAAVGFNKDRTHVFFASQNVDIIRVFPQFRNTGDPFECIPVRLDLPPIDLDIEIHGDVVTKDFWVQSGGAAPLTFLVIETYWDDPDKGS